MNFALANLWREPGRYWPGVLAVAFSALLMTLQCGLLMGLLSLTSIPVDHAAADVWVGHPVVRSVDIARPIPARWAARLLADPEVVHVEEYVLNLLMVDNPQGTSNVCTVIGTATEDGAVGVARELSPQLRDLLGEPGAVVVDEADMGRLGFHEVGDTAEVLGRRVRLVGTSQGLRGLAAPYLFCSAGTARLVMPSIVTPDQASYLLARCVTPQAADAVAGRLRSRYPDMSVYTRAEFSRGTQWYWLTATKSGIAVGGSALLGLLVGAVVASQTLYSATAASLKEYATLRALGVPNWRVSMAVLQLAGWVGGLGVILSIPPAFAGKLLVDSLGARVLLPAWLLVLSGAVTLITALLSGLAALRSLRRLEPAELLR